ncbi:hypothetical protein M758_1G125700 [Ceratodon purpureus]|nr:hypothetical protein M758_1G125700 [Ceratodon purpureus]
MFHCIKIMAYCQSALMCWHGSNSVVIHILRLPVSTKLLMLKGMYHGVLIGLTSGNVSIFVVPFKQASIMLRVNCDLEFSLGTRAAHKGYGLSSILEKSLFFLRMSLYLPSVP